MSASCSLCCNLTQNKNQSPHQGLKRRCTIRSLHVQSLSHVPTLWDPMNSSTPALPVLHYLPEFAKMHVHWVSDPSNHLIFCYPLFLLSSIFPSIRVFSNDSALYIRLPKYWSFSFSINPSNEYSSLISFRTNLFFLLAVLDILKGIFEHNH